MRKNGAPKKERVDREKFLHQLHMVSPGLSQKERIDQSNCFLFRKGRVSTFNDDVACTCPSEIKCTCVVPAAPLLSTLENIRDSQVDITLQSALLVQGKHHRTKIVVSDEIADHFNSIPDVEEWFDLPEQFQDAISSVHPCASSDVSEFMGTCLHFHPKWIEGCDGRQAGRFRLSMPLKESILLKKDSVQHLLREEAIQFSEDPQWAHFKTAHDLRISCQRYIDEYPTLDKFFRKVGEILYLKKALVPATERAAMFLDDSKHEGISVKLTTGSVEVQGKGAMGEHTTRGKIDYDGPPVQFLIPPTVLIRIATDYSKCRITDKKITINKGGFLFAAALEVQKDVE